MSQPEKWLRASLAAASSAGVYPVVAIAKAPLPLIVYRRTATSRDRSLTGGYGLPVAVFSVAIVAETYQQAKEIAESVRLSLDNFTGTDQGVIIIKSALASESDSMEAPLEGRDKPLYRVDQSYEVRFRE